MLSFDQGMDGQKIHVGRADPWQRLGEYVPSFERDSLPTGTDFAVDRNANARVAHGLEQAERNVIVFNPPLATTTHCESGTFEISSATTAETS